ncbi:MAG: hypothetical protein F6K30_16780 [Cyanothece sp. SIO2G6]|nr:hypothetical protein [Cyanothece sp. SIO2G6]
MHQHVVEICQTLAQAGAVPGADFSIDPTDGGLRLNELGYRLLAQLYPDIDWADVARVIQPNWRAAIKQLHKHLGINFFDRILDCIQQRVTDLPPTQSACYLTQILTGVEHRTGISLYHLLLRTVDVSRFIYIENLLASAAEMESCNLWIGDLVWAAGGDREDVDYSGGDVVLTENGLKLFEQVWAGDSSVHEL